VYHREVILLEHLQAIAEVAVDLKVRSIKELYVEEALKDESSPVLIP
jgi:hypothetical protein